MKAAFPFLHNWLQDSYPEATVTGTVFLSAFTTKLAIYALARGFAGTSFLVPVGLVMTLFPIIFAVIENDLRKVLAYSLNNQLGYMVVGVGIGTNWRSTAQRVMPSPIFSIRGFLFMSMGAVLYRTGTIKANELGGLYKIHATDLLLLHYRLAFHFRLPALQWLCDEIDDDDRCFSIG